MYAVPSNARFFHNSFYRKYPLLPIIREASRLWQGQIEQRRIDFMNKQESFYTHVSIMQKLPREVLDKWYSVDGPVTPEYTDSVKKLDEYNKEWGLCFHRSGPWFHENMFRFYYLNKDLWQVAIKSLSIVQEFKDATQSDLDKAVSLKQEGQRFLDESEGLVSQIREHDPLYEHYHSQGTSMHEYPLIPNPPRANNGVNGNNGTNESNGESD